MDGHTPTNPPINQQHFSRSPPKVFWIIISCSARYPVRPLFHFSINHLQTFFLSLLFPPRCEPVLDSHHQSHPSIHHHCVAVWRISYSYPYFPVPASHFMSFLIPKDIPIPKQKAKNKNNPRPPLPPPFHLLRTNEYQSSQSTRSDSSMPPLYAYMLYI